MDSRMAMRCKAYVCSRWIAGWRVRIPLGAWMFVCCVVCCVVSSYCYELMPRSEESYRVCLHMI